MKNLLLVLCMALVPCFGLDCHAQEDINDDNINLTSSEQSILEAFGSAVDMIANWFSLETLQNTVEDTYNFVSSTFTGLTESFTQLLNDWGVLDGLISAFNSTVSAGESAVNFVYGLINTVTGWMNDVINGVGGALNDAGEWVTDTGGDIVDGVGDVIDDIGGGLGGLFGGMILADNGEPFPIEASVNDEGASDLNTDEPTTAFLPPPNSGAVIGLPPQPNQVQDAYTIANFSESDVYLNPLIVHPIFNGQFPEWSLVDFNAHNIDNTPDILKPVSSTQQEELSKFPVWASAPLYSNDVGSEGAIAFDENYFYAYENGAWNRVTLASW